MPVRTSRFLVSFALIASVAVAGCESKKPGAVSGSVSSGSGSSTKGGAPVARVAPTGPAGTASNGPLAANSGAAVVPYPSKKPSGTPLVPNHCEINTSGWVRSDNNSPRTGETRTKTAK